MFSIEIVLRKFKIYHVVNKSTQLYKIMGEGGCVGGPAIFPKYRKSIEKLEDKGKISVKK